MQVGDLVSRIITTYDGSGLNQFQSELLRGVRNSEQAAKGVQQLDTALQRLRQSSDVGSRALGYTLSILSAASPVVERFRAGVELVGGAFRIIQQGGSAALSALKNGLEVLFGPLTRFVRGILDLINPLNIIRSAIDTLGRAGEIAFGVVLFNALAQLTRQALEFVNALSPLSTGIFAGEIGTQMKALAVTAANFGFTVDQIKGSVSGIRILGIEASEAIKAITQGFQVGLNPSQIQQLARAAQDMAVVIGTNSSDAFNRLFSAISTGNTQLLRFAGIMKTQDQLIEDFARKSGKSIQEIRGNINLLRQAFFQGILDEAKKFSGAYEASLEELGKKLSSFPRQFNDLRLGIGKLFEPFLSGAFTFVEETTEALSRLFFTTKKGAYEAAAAQVAQSTGIKLTARDLSDLVIATIEGGEQGEAAFKRIAAATGVPVEALKDLQQQGLFTTDAIAKIGHAFEPTALGTQIRALSYAVGSFASGLAKSIFEVINGGQAALQDAVPGMIQAGIKAVAGFALGIVSGINSFVIPGVISLVSAIIQVLTGGAAALATVGVSMAGSLISGITSGILSGLSTLGSVIANVFTSLLGGLANGALFLSDAKNWGKAIPGAASEGVKEGEFNLTQVLKDLRDAASRVFSDPNAQATDIIGNWGRGIVRTVLESLKARDFSALSFLEGIVRSIFGNGAEEQAVAASNAVAQALADLNNTGAISAQTLTSLASAFGAAFGDVQKYLQAVNEMNIGLDKQEQLENDLEDATDAVQDAQERLRQFESDSAGIPERYTRGRRAQLQAELDAAQKEQEKRRDALRDQQKANEKVREAVELQRSLLTELVRAAELQAKIAQDKANETVDPADVPIDDIDAQIKRIANDFRQQILDAFAPVRQQFEILGNTLRGILGLDAVIPEPPDPADFYQDPEGFAEAQKAYDRQVAAIQAAHDKGETLRDTLTNLKDIVVPGIVTAFEKVETVLKRIVALVGAFVSGLTGGKLPQATDNPAGARDPKATEPADAGLAGAFKLGQDTINAINTAKSLLTQAQAFAQAHPDGVKIIAALAGLELATGIPSNVVGAMAGSLIAGLTTALVTGAGSIMTSLFAAMGEATVAAIAGVGLPGTIATAVFGTLLAPEFLAGVAISALTALALAFVTGSAAFGYSVSSALAEALGNALGFDVDFPGVTESLGKLKDAFVTGGLPAMLDVAGQLVGQLGTAFTSLFDGLKGSMGEAVTNGFAYLFGPLLLDLDALMNDPENSLLGTIRTAVDKIASIFTGAQDTVEQAVKGVTNVIVSAFQGAYDVLVGNSIIPDLVAAIIGIFAAMPSGLAEPLANVASAIIAPFQSAADAAQGLIARITGQDAGDTPAPQSNGRRAEQPPPQSNSRSAPVPIETDSKAGEKAETTVKRVDAALANSQAAVITQNTITEPVKGHFTKMQQTIGDEEMPKLSGKVTGSLTDLATKVVNPSRTTVNNIVSPFNDLQQRLKDALKVAGAVVMDKVGDMTTITNTFKQAFIDLGTAAQAQMEKVKAAVQSNLNGIKTGLADMRKQIVLMIEDINKAFKELGRGPVLEAIEKMTATMLRLFRELFDELVGHSIVPDLVDGIVGEFQDLDPRTKSPLEKFTAGVTNTIDGIDGKFENLGTAGKPGARGASGAGKLEITVNQSNWSFPANMDARQQDLLRKLAREEAYMGITLAFTKATGAT